MRNKKNEIFQKTQKKIGCRFLASKIIDESLYIFISYALALFFSMHPIIPTPGPINESFIYRHDDYIYRSFIITRLIVAPIIEMISLFFCRKTLGLWAFGLKIENIKKETPSRFHASMRPLMLAIIFFSFTICSMAIFIEDLRHGFFGCASFLGCLIILYSLSMKLFLLFKGQPEVTLVDILSRTRKCIDGEPSRIFACPHFWLYFLIAHALAFGSWQAIDIPQTTGSWEKIGMAAK